MSSFASSRVSDSLSQPLYPELKSSDSDGTVGYDRCANVIRRFTDCKYFRVSSSCMACACDCAPIFSRAERSWMPTDVTPIGHGALPIATPTYTSAAWR